MGDWLVRKRLVAIYFWSFQETWIYLWKLYPLDEEHWIQNQYYLGLAVKNPALEWTSTTNFILCSSLIDNLLSCFLSCLQQKTFFSIQVHFTIFYMHFQSGTATFKLERQPLQIIASTESCKSIVKVSSHQALHENISICIMRLHSFIETTE